MSTLLESTSISYIATVINILAPDATQVIGTSDFRIEGTAFVRMHSTTFIKQGSQDETFEHSFIDGGAIKSVLLPAGFRGIAANSTQSQQPQGARSGGGRPRRGRNRTLSAALFPRLEPDRKVFLQTQSPLAQGRQANGRHAVETDRRAAS